MDKLHSISLDRGLRSLPITPYVNSLTADPSFLGHNAVSARISKIVQFITTSLALHANKLKGDASWRQQRRSHHEFPNTTGKSFAPNRQHHH
jgi:hypothetical protein